MNTEFFPVKYSPADKAGGGNSNDDYQGYPPPYDRDLFPDRLLQEAGRVIRDHLEDTYLTDESGRDRDPWTLTALPDEYQHVATITTALETPRMLRNAEWVYAAFGAMQGLNPAGFEDDRLIQGIRGVVYDSAFDSRTAAVDRLKASPLARAYAYLVVYKGIHEALTDDQRKQNNGTKLFQWIVDHIEGPDDLQIGAKQLEAAYALMEDDTVREEAVNIWQRSTVVDQLSDSVLTLPPVALVGEKRPTLFSNTVIQPDHLCDTYSPKAKRLAHLPRQLMRFFTQQKLQATLLGK